MGYKKGTPEYELWKSTPAYDLYCKRISIAMTGERNPNYGKHPSAETLTKRSGERHPMYGKHHSAETLAKMRAANTGERHYMYGKHHSDETKRRMSVAKTGKLHPHRGHRHSEETLAKIRTAKIGKHPSAETRTKMSIAQAGERNPMYGKHHSKETLAKMRAAKIGGRNPNWCGGSSPDPYPIGWSHHLREMIRERDKFTCALCGKKQNKRRHPVHHINYNKKDIRPENLITLCTNCHQKTNRNREYWKNLFQIIYVPNFSKRRTKNESES